MIANALRELRHRPTRLIATWLGIALSVAFLVSTQTLARTELVAIGKDMVGETRNADLVVTAGAGGAEAPARQQVERALKTVPGTFDDTASSASILGEGNKAQFVSISEIPQADELRAGRVVEGHWPQSRDEIVVSRFAAGGLGVHVGDRTKLGEHAVTVVGLTDDPKGFLQTRVRVHHGYLPPDTSAMWLVKVPAGTSVSDLRGQLTAALAGLKGMQVRTPGEVGEQIVTEMIRGVNPFEVIATGFGGLAMLVGAIMIATTFAILVAQRRRQIGLQRMVGATTGQVRGSLLVEAAVVGLIGSLLGLAFGMVLAAGVAAWTGSLGFGLDVPWPAVVLSLLAGVLVTVVAAWAPILRTSRITPMEAIRVADAAESRGGTILRAVVCGVLVVAGLGVAAFSLTLKSGALLMGLFAGSLLAVGVLAATPLYVPLLLRAFGALAHPFGPVARLAASNSRRHVGRSAATAAALAMALGLVMTLQVGTASVKATAVSDITARYPVDIKVSSWSEDLKPALIDKLRKVPGISEHAVLRGGKVDLNAETTSRPVNLFAATPEMAAVLPIPLPSLGAGDVLVGTGVLGENVESGQVTITTESGRSVTLQARTTRILTWNEALVSPETQAMLVPDAGTAAIWFMVADKQGAAQVVTAITDITGGDSTLQVDGGLVQSTQLIQILDMLLAIATALLAVAVVIALVGVGNTLGLSVLERTRESALLRALGLQRAGLRGSLAVEALLIGLAGVVIGLLAGFGFGWLGASVLTRESSMSPPVLVVDPVVTGATVLIALAAAVVASVVPGRKAASASPTEALADVG